MFKAKTLMTSHQRLSEFSSHLIVHTPSSPFNIQEIILIVPSAMLSDDIASYSWSYDDCLQYVPPTVSSH